MTIKKILSVASIGVMLATVPGLAYAGEAGDPLKCQRRSKIGPKGGVKLVHFL